MKSIIRFIIPTNYGIIITIVILAFMCIPSVFCSPPSCGLYGAPPCRYLPAPPGQTPACARPGKTYCEHVDNYPTYLIKHLVHKWGYEAKNLIVDETWDDFAAVAWHNTPVFYDPAFIFPQRPNYNGNQNDFTGYDYDTPPIVNGGGNAGSGNDDKYSKDESTFLVTKQQQQQPQTTPAPTFLLYTSAGQRLNYKNGHKLTPNNPTFWLKRIVRDLSRSDFNDTMAVRTSPVPPSSSSSSSSSVPLSISKRDVSLNLDLMEIMGIERVDDKEIKKQRVKRQSPGRSTLCQTTSQFIAPQAALNNKGNWMFVVNEPSSARQLVKAELCASNTCSNLCQLPNGYNSRCEQKFAQKRLIALQANGQNLYTDTFWFPSCCVCTISAN